MLLMAETDNWSHSLLASDRRARRRLWSAKKGKVSISKGRRQVFLRNRLIALPQQFPRPLELHWSHRNGTNGHRLCSWRKRCLHREEITIENQIAN